MVDKLADIRYDILRIPMPCVILKKQDLKEDLETIIKTFCEQRALKPVGDPFPLDDGTVAIPVATKTWVEHIRES